MASMFSVAPSFYQNLSAWKLQLPVDAQSQFLGKAAEIKALEGYYNKSYFYAASDGAMIFRAPVYGATTGNSDFARSELREMNGSVPAEWTLKEGGHLSATLEVDIAPTKVNGTAGKIVIGQIHGGDSQLVRLAWVNGKIYFANDVTANGQRNLHVKLLDAQGNEPSVSLNERFSYSMDVTDKKLVVSVIADGKTYTSTSKINASWLDNMFYFKAGAYLGVNEKTGRGEGQTSFYALDVDHDGGLSQTVAPIVRASTTLTINGTSKDDFLIGKSSNDFISGGYGNDSLNGSYGRDILTGGEGNDRFVFNKNPSTDNNSDIVSDFVVNSDQIILEDSKYKMLKFDDLSHENFVRSNHAIDGDDFLFYDRASGELYYDRDGSGSQIAQQIAIFENHANLSYGDFVIV